MSVWYMFVCACCMDVSVYVVHVVHAYIQMQVHTPEGATPETRGCHQMSSSNLRLIPWKQGLSLKPE